MITEKQIDLFEEIEKEPCCIFHCISSDLAMGAGIAKPMQEKFHIRENWKSFTNFGNESNWLGNGWTLAMPVDKNILFNLVTKEKYWHKPTYITLRQALEHAKEGYFDLLNFPKKIVMPKIGCGLDRLDWNKVKPMIEKIFDGFDIVVCYL